MAASSTSDPSGLGGAGPRPPVDPARVAVARVVQSTSAEGPGVRAAIWVQGCSIRCPGCFNPHLWTGGRHFVHVDDVAARVIPVAGEGVTLLGGEPFDQAAPLAVIAERVQACGKSVMTFTGFRLEQLVQLAPTRPDVAALLAHTDLLVDGPYLQERLDVRRPWVGSTNQRFHHLSRRYADAHEQLQHGSDRLEVRVLPDGSVEVNGWASAPALEALLAGLGRRGRRA